MKKKRGRKTKRSDRPARPEFKHGCTDFAANLEAVRDLARDHDLTVDVSIAECGYRKTYHVMFKQGETRVLDYWPATGKTWSMLTGAKNVAADGWMALDQAARIAAMGTADQESHLDAIRPRSHGVGTSSALG